MSLSRDRCNGVRHGAAGEQAQSTGQLAVHTATVDAESALVRLVASSTLTTSSWANARGAEKSTGLDRGRQLLYPLSCDVQFLFPPCVRRRFSRTVRRPPTNTSRPVSGEQSVDRVVLASPADQQIRLPGVSVTSGRGQRLNESSTWVEVVVSSVLFEFRSATSETSTLLQFSSWVWVVTGAIPLVTSPRRPSRLEPPVAELSTSGPAWPNSQSLTWLSVNSASAGSLPFPRGC